MTREIIPASWQMQSVKKRDAFYYADAEYPKPKRLQMVVETRSTMEIGEVVDVLILTGEDEIQVMREMEVYSFTVKLSRLNTCILVKRW